MSEGSIPPDQIALPISKAAALVGLSRVQFYRKFVWSGLLPTYDIGARGRSVKVHELRAVVDRIEPSAPEPRGGRKDRAEAAAG